MYFLQGKPPNSSFRDVFARSLLFALASHNATTDRKPPSPSSLRFASTVHNLTSKAARWGDEIVGWFRLSGARFALQPTSRFLTVRLFGMTVGDIFAKNS